MTVAEESRSCTTPGKVAYGDDDFQDDGITSSSSISKFMVRYGAEETGPDIGSLGVTAGRGGIGGTLAFRGSGSLTWA